MAPVNIHIVGIRYTVLSIEVTTSRVEDLASLAWWPTNSHIEESVE